MEMPVLRFVPPILLAAALALQWPVAALAGEFPGFSYRRIYELLYQFEALPEAETSHLEFRARAVHPRGTPPGKLTIAHGEPIDVPVDGYGLFTVPMSPQLAQLNPRVVAETDAPLRLGLAILIRLPAEGTPDGEWLLEGIRQANAAIRARSRVDPRLVPQAHGVTLRFTPGTDASVGVIVDGEAVGFEPDAEGRVNLPLDPRRHADAVVSMSHRPAIIFPLFD